MTYRGLCLCFFPLRQDGSCWWSEDQSEAPCVSHLLDLWPFFGDLGLISIKSVLGNINLLFRLCLQDALLDSPGWQQSQPHRQHGSRDLLQLSWPTSVTQVPIRQGTKRQSNWGVSGQEETTKSRCENPASRVIESWILQTAPRTSILQSKARNPRIWSSRLMHTVLSADVHLSSLIPPGGMKTHFASYGFKVDKRSEKFKIYSRTRSPLTIH